MSASPAYWLGPNALDYYARNEPTPGRILVGREALHQALPARLRHQEALRVLEVGVGSGVLFRAARATFHETLSLSGVDINPEAVKLCAGVGDVRVADVTRGLPFADGAFDLVYTWGLLIHIPPEGIEAAYREIARVCAPLGDVLLMEYFAPEPEEHVYRGHEGVLWRRDYGAGFLDANTGWYATDHGFLWARVDGASINWWRFTR